VDRFLERRKGEKWLHSQSALSELRKPSVADILWNDQRRMITIGHKIIALTQSEYRLLSPLRYGLPVPYTHLTLALYKRAPNEKIRGFMDKHIERIRGKLKGSGFYIYCVLGYGYLLLPEKGPDEE
jgi:DNA-binding response OmpR family regulator